MENLRSSLGLAVVEGKGLELMQELVKMMKGKISLEKEHGIGTTLVINLPENILLRNEIPKTVEQPFIEKVRETVENNISDENFGITELCKAMCFSRSQLHNKIKAATNLSTSIFVRTVKLEKAKHLLTESEYSISEIAYQLGFKDPSYFTRIFTEEFGFPPSKMNSPLVKVAAGTKAKFKGLDKSYKLVPLTKNHLGTYPIKKEKKKSSKRSG